MNRHQSFTVPNIFSICCTPIHLHSFPTRRSSDLEIATQRVGVVEHTHLAYANQPFVRHHLDEGQIPPGRTQDSRDRKSTRLNSSHMSISYAVFCLKKKTNQ